MSQRDVESLLGRLVTDADVRRRFFGDPEGTLAREPYHLSAEEIAALVQLGDAPLVAFAATVDASILRASLEAAPPEASVRAGTKP